MENEESRLTNVLEKIAGVIFGSFPVLLVVAIIVIPIVVICNSDHKSLIEEYAEKGVTHCMVTEIKDLKDSDAYEVTFKVDGSLEWYTVVTDSEWDVKKFSEKDSPIAIGDYRFVKFDVENNEYSAPNSVETMHKAISVSHKKG